MEVTDSLPVGIWVKVVPCKESGKFEIVTSFLGFKLGTRLLKTGTTMPKFGDGITEGITLDKAREVFKVWERFCEDQAVRKRGDGNSLK